VSWLLHSRRLSTKITQVLVEEFISGREFTIGVFKNKNEIMVLPITEIVTKNEFFDFEAKYQGKSEETTPAKIDADDAEATGISRQKSL
jgi:D-alanine-D-alanine ligase